GGRRPGLTGGSAVGGRGSGPAGSGQRAQLLIFSIIMLRNKLVVLRLSAMDTFTAFEYAVASTAEIIKGVRPGQGTAPTPCTEWDVRSLLSHVIGTLWLAEGLFTGQAPRYPMPPGGLPAADVGGDDPVAAYSEASAAALAAAGAGDALTRVYATPLGNMPGPALAGFTTLDMTV